MTTRTKKKLDIELLWRLERIGAPSLSPDGAQAVAAVTRHSMKENKGASSLWLMSTLGGEPRRLTSCGEKDGEPRFSPDGSLIAFTAKREQEGKKDDEPQLYLIAPDGGEARRAAEVATGVEGFRWCPDGKSLVFASWVWPELRGAKAQAARHKAFKERKESGYATSEAQYRYWDHNLPMGRVTHLHRLMLGAPGEPGRVRDLFEGKPYELPRSEVASDTFDISPDGRHAVFIFDPAPEKRPDGRYALAEIELNTGRIRVIAQHDGWDFDGPRYSPDGKHIAFTASHQAKKHTMPAQLAIWNRASGRWAVQSAAWDRAVHKPLKWSDDGQALLFCTEEQGRRHLWRWGIAARRAEVQVPGGWVSGFDVAAGTLVTLADSASHPARLSAQALDAGPGAPLRRIERFNDALLAGVKMGAVEEMWIKGAQDEPVQVWLTYPPDFNPKKKYPLLHDIHGGPHTGPGDGWHYRWNTQVFAAEGYVVAAVNYHGSSGFGHAFLDSITHRWGELELQDIEAATDALVKKPFIDRKRLFAAGGSYGGYMVAWMNGHVKPGRYRAYICHAGCFDWVGMFADDAWAWHAKELGGWYWDDMQKPLAQSPHNFAKGFKTPTLVIHGALDYRVPDAQGLAYYNTLKALKVPSRLLWFPDENHWILKPRNSRLWYEEFFGWLKAHDTTKKK
jgi:dipeptidyl aminopeptidase/acylaminoacyl peptidase